MFKCSNGVNSTTYIIYALNVYMEYIVQHTSYML